MSNFAKESCGFFVGVAGSAALLLTVIWLTSDGEMPNHFGGLGFLVSMSGIATAKIFRRQNVGAHFDRLSFGMKSRFPLAVYGAWALLWFGYLIASKNDFGQWYDYHTKHFWLMLIIPPNIVLGAIIVFRWADASNLRKDERTVSGNRTHDLIVDDINAMLGPQNRRFDAAFVLSMNPYLFGYVLGRIRINIQMDCRISPACEEKLWGAVAEELFPSYLANAMKAHFKLEHLRPKHRAMVQRGMADAERVFRYSCGADYSLDPDAAKAIAWCADMMRLTAQGGFKFDTSGQNFAVVNGMNDMYFSSPFWQEMYRLERRDMEQPRR